MFTLLQPNVKLINVIAIPRQDIEINGKLEPVYTKHGHEIAKWPNHGMK